ncbi:MAG TPA: ferrochelatase [Thermoanaerobaculia bacterium]|nr:ferrochelatase [Thermoanaerobaculia bacterium]
MLAINLGTPDAPEPRAIRRYLRQFLSDPRVVELPRWRWWPVLYGIVLPLRPRRVAKLYRTVWTAEGSPLLAISRRQARGLADRLATSSGEAVQVELGMRYGNPSIGSALRALQARGCERILAFPLFPQYAAATTASALDEVARELRSFRRWPHLRAIAGYHDHAGYLDALAASIVETWRDGGPPERLVCSYHGIPERYYRHGDPYPDQCHDTTRRLATRLPLETTKILTTFQSQFGRERWVAPATDATLQTLAREGVRHVGVVCPGFSADCLETLEEIDGQNRELFLHAGGETFRFVPCLNDRDDHLDALADIARRDLAGWLDELREAPLRQWAGA